MPSMQFNVRDEDGQIKPQKESNIKESSKKKIRNAEKGKSTSKSWGVGERRNRFPARTTVGILQENAFEDEEGKCKTDRSGSYLGNLDSDRSEL